MNSDMKPRITMDNAALIRVEQQRLELEASIAKLKKALRHWQNLEIDYQGLSEEFIGRPENLAKDVSLKIGQDYGADIVDEKELRELINYDKGPPRKPEQIVELLSKRVEYVNRNVDTIRKQLSDAERKRNVLLLAEEPNSRDDAALPMTEITEELDEEGNVLSSKVQGCDEAGVPLANVLKKAGVKGIEDEGGRVVAIENRFREPRATAPPLSATAPDVSDATSDRRVSTTPATDRSHTNDVSQALRASQNGAFGGLEARSTQRDVKVPVESAEDAAFRAEMLEYYDGLGEVGAIVAELDLEDGEVSIDDEDVEDDDLSLPSDYDEDEDLDDESDDEKGMSRHSLQSEAYLRKMKLLEKKHGITGMSNLGPKPELPDEVQDQINRPPPAEAARKAALARAEAVAAETSSSVVEKLPKTSKPKKRVAFASTLDIATDTKPAAKKQELTAKAPIVMTTKPLKESIVERPAKATVGTDQSAPSKKVSRFKAARNETPRTPMFAPASASEPQSFTGPAGKIYSPSIVERATALENSASAPGGDDDGIDEVMHSREIATEYHQLRNRMIQRQGGFVNEGEQNNWGDATAPLPFEDEAGKVRKVSRFKAARMK
jgi:unconventional prefoldin RPB5 interactor 1